MLTGGSRPRWARAAQRRRRIASFRSSATVRSRRSSITATAGCVSKPLRASTDPDRSSGAGVAPSHNAHRDAGASRSRRAACICRRHRRRAMRRATMLWPSSRDCCPRTPARSPTPAFVPRSAGLGICTASVNNSECTGKESVRKERERGTSGLRDRWSSRALFGCSTSWWSFAWSSWPSAWSCEPAGRPADDSRPCRSA